jgi:hypothetical protein
VVAEVESGWAGRACNTSDTVVGAGVVVCRGDEGEVGWVDAAGVVTVVGDVEVDGVPHAGGLAGADAGGEDDDGVDVEGEAKAGLVGELDGGVAGVAGAGGSIGDEAACLVCRCALVGSEFEFEEAARVSGQVLKGPQGLVGPRHGVRRKMNFRGALFY